MAAHCRRDTLECANGGVLVIPLVIFLGVASQPFGVNQEYQRAVLFRLGRLGTSKGPGWYRLIPFIGRVVKVDLRAVPDSRRRS